MYVCVLMYSICMQGIVHSSVTMGVLPFSQMCMCMYMYMYFLHVENMYNVCINILWHTMHIHMHNYIAEDLPRSGVCGIQWRMELPRSGVHLEENFGRDYSRLG